MVMTSMLLFVLKRAAICQYTFFIISFLKNIEAQIWSEFFPKTMEDSLSGYGSFPNEGGTKKRLVIGVCIKYGSKLRASEPRPEFNGSYKKIG